MVINSGRLRRRELKEEEEEEEEEKEKKHLHVLYIHRLIIQLLGIGFNFP
jgi:hypothetical protein